MGPRGLGPGRDRAAGSRSGTLGPKRGTFARELLDSIGHEGLLEVDHVVHSRVPSAHSRHVLI
jgi:hypothetical protein